MKNGKRLTRVHPERAAGRFNKRAPYWLGERAEDIVAARQEENAKNKKTRSGPSGNGKSRRRRAERELPERHSSSKELRRLERALGRRKTLAARQRLRKRIADLKSELGL